MNDAKFEIGIDELEDVLEEELHLYENTSLEYAAEFLESFLKYLKHNRTTGIGGRTPGTLRSNLRDFKDFAFSHGFKMEEIYVILRRFPGILNISLDNLEQKYKLMALAEDETGTLRKRKLLLAPDDFKIGNDLIYARYMLMTKLGYSPITWRNLIHDSQNDFAKKFVRTDTGYSKPYKIFNDVSELSRENLVKMFPMDLETLDEILSVKKEVKKDEKENNGNKSFGV